MTPVGIRISGVVSPIEIPNPILRASVVKNIRGACIMPQHSRTDWFHAARWGVAAHYLADFSSCATPDDLPAEEWNRQVDAFEVERLADQLAAAQVGYFMLTIGQNSGH